MSQPLGNCPDCGTESRSPLGKHLAVCTPCSIDGGTVKSFAIGKTRIQLDEQQVASRLQTFGDTERHMTQLAQTTQFVHVF